MLVLLGRLLLDLHMWTIFKHNQPLQWVRRELLPSTSLLLGICALLLLLDQAGLEVLTYIKPVVVSTMFIISSAVYPAPFAYILAFRQIKKIRK